LEKFEMKKTLVAMAVMAVAGVASAQVTLYGKIDAGVEYKDAGGVTTTKIASGQFSGSRWGMKGSEDLGGGLSANFQLEGGFSLDTGITGQTSGTGTAAGSAGQARIFGRTAQVGVSGAFGTVTLGRQYTPTDNVLWMPDPMGTTGALAGPMYAVFSGTGTYDTLGNGRQNNAVSYSIPSMNGLNAQLMFAPDESDVDAHRYVGANMSYAAGPLTAAVAWESTTATNATKSTTGWLLGGAYDLGAFKLGGEVMGGTTSTDSTTTGWYLGASAPVGAATLSAGYANAKVTTAASVETKSNAWGINATYSLSKRTNVYGGWTAKEDTVGAAATVKTNGLVAGVRHDF